MLFRNIWVIGMFVIAASCSVAPKSQLRSCTNGHTMLDDTCVSQEVANYVSCVRSHGAELGTERENNLSAEVGYLFAKVSGASEFSEKLNKKYSASDKVMLAIIKRCDFIAGIKATNATSRKIYGAIEVISATYGKNCGTPTGNVTAHIANSCNGNRSCNYRIHHRVIGDPAYGCAKTYEASYKCSNSGTTSVKTVFAKAEAGYGSIVNLYCN